MLSIARRIPLWAPYLILATGLIALSFYVPHDDVFSAGQDIADPGQATLTILQEIMKLVLTLNAAMLAAAGTLVLKGKEWSGGWSRIESVLVILVFLAGVVSYFGVYSCQVSILTMVNVGAMNPLETSLLWALRLQYFGLIAGALLLGLVFALMLDRVRLQLTESEPSSKPLRRVRRAPKGAVQKGK